ncbi:unnamed protein product [Adineta steineri]|uniref:EGF-like domain-containing protein n=1 Tax=Adineta steineri TaxID=433720 RepID=A0A813NMP8_9BILA|nr:unnamed protein product [Adineta steineri]CAF4029647.1 unnamed protein product [Adineta steineri]
MDFMTCLYYNVPHDTIDASSSNSRVHKRQIIPYCISNQNEPLLAVGAFTVRQTFTFDQLRQQNITSELLYSWATSIDLVEDYEIYLRNETALTDPLEKVFYNCSLGWFGRLCQYTFIKSLSLVQPTFTDVVTQVFDIKLEEFSAEVYQNPRSYTVYSCYTHIKCERDLPHICLDWREICDGKVDCSNDGQDEMFCAELEMTDCSENEYRCHNGAQCIPKEMYYDGKFNIDCLDSTDEPEPLLNSHCVGDPSFRCEERSCPHSFLFPCGDGECQQRSFLYSNELIDNYDHCRNGRHNFVNEIVLSRNSNLLISHECWRAMFCYFQYANVIDDKANCGRHPCNELLTEDCIKIIVNSCQSTPQFVFPQSSLAFVSEIDLVYDINALLNKTHSDLQPTYACFRNQRCAEFLGQVTQVANKSGCKRVPFSSGADESVYWMHTNWYDDLIDLVRMCNAVDPTALNMTHCRADNLVHCQVNQRCISKSRLMDGFSDCYSGLDEKELLSETSCSINDHYRSQCSAKNDYKVETLCLSLIFDEDFLMHKCLNADDILHPINQAEVKIPPFSHMCDQILDMDPIDGESDETHCADWPCDNAYTRCDGIWHCSNGLDESNCKNSMCPPYTLPCVLPTNNSVICLPLSKMDDNITDCRGATDERLFCRKKYPFETDRRYKCWNDSNCIKTKFLCDTGPYQQDDPSVYNHCKLYGDDQHFCHFFDTDSAVCESEYTGNRTIQEKILCGLSEKYILGGYRITQDVLHLSAAYAGYYPDDLFGKTEFIIDINNSTSLQLKQNDKTLLPKISFEDAWFCYRGIYVMVSRNRNRRCLCPPSYYGPRCEYQNRRVSLTLQFRTMHLSSTWDTTVFHFFVRLISEDNTIDSNDQIIYSPLRDCNTKFDVYLLYKDHPKNRSKKYSVRVDAYVKNDLTYYASWHISIPFSFLPVNRISTILTIPLNVQQSKHGCDENSCGKHGRCIRYVSSSDFFCQCDTDWKGRVCHIKRHRQDGCRCSTNSLCIEPGLCLCPLYNYGKRCYIESSSCKLNTCLNGGFCIPDDQRVSHSNFTCICNEGYWGERCEHVSTRINIYFVNIPIPEGIHTHFIKAYENNLAPHERTTTLTRITPDKDFATLQAPVLFNILFIEFNHVYYLAVVQQEHSLRNYISTTVNPSRQCLPIEMLLNSTDLLLPILRRVKDLVTLFCIYDCINELYFMG